MPINPLSAATPRLDRKVSGPASNPRMALIADLLNNAAPTGSGLMRLEPLLSLLSDTETLSLFIRHAGLSKEQGAALARDVATSTGRLGGSLSLTGGELDDVLSRIRPTTGGVNGSYRANLPNGETAFGSTPQDFRQNSTVNGRLESEGLFTAFSPSPQDYVNTVDDISVQGRGGVGHGPGLPPGWFTPADPSLERIRGISNMACVVLACLVGIPVFAFFLMFR
jgi:hypothetical protein